MSAAVQEVETTAVRPGGTAPHLHTLTPRRHLDKSGVHPSGSQAHWIETLRHPSTRAAVRLRFPLRVDISIDEDDSGHIVEVPFLGLAGAGETYQDALDDLAGSILFIRANLDGDTDERLTADALALRERLRSLIA